MSFRFCGGFGRYFLYLAVLAAELAFSQAVGVKAAYADTPQIFPGGVVNGATYVRAPGNTVAPGAIVAIFGSGLAVSPGYAGQLPLPTSLNGTQVLVDGIAAPIVFVSPAQINAQVPFEVQINTTVQVVVRVDGAGDSPAEPVRVTSASPGVFTQSADGNGPAYVLHSDYSLVTAASPAKPGDVLLLYATGLGLTNPSLRDGYAGDGEPTLETPTVTIGGQNAPVQFSGAAPGYVGLYQINIMVPDVVSGDEPLVVNMQFATLSSPAGVTVPVQSGSTVVTVGITPASRVLTPGQTQQFTPTVSGSLNSSVTWSVNGIPGGNATVGTISTTGLYTAPAALPANANITITATSSADTTKSSSAAIMLVAANQGIQPTYFGLHIAPPYFTGTRPWPTINFGALRLLGDTVQWVDVNPSPGVFDFKLLDAILAKAKAEGKDDILYTLFKTPTWAASATNAPCSDFAGRTGGCAPPNDLNPDGTGTNQHWKDYVTAIVQHAGGEGPGQIRSWEIWNEPNTRNLWTGTNAQLLRMAKDAYQIIKAFDPNLIVTTPPATGAGESTGAQWAASYFALGGLQWADVVAFHGYITAAHAPYPETVLGGINIITSALAGNSLGGKPLWDTEGGWNLETSLPDLDMEAAFVGRYYLLQDTVVARFYWYAYDYPTGTLYDLNTKQLNKAGVAYGQVYNWLVGATPVTPCSANGSVWTCHLSRPGGYDAVAVWDASQTCSNGTCTSSSFVTPPSYTIMRDLAGGTTSISPGDSVQIGAKPVLLSNQ